MHPGGFICESTRGSDDMYSLCLSMLCVANFAAYERMVLAVSSSKRLGKHLPAEEMTRALDVIWWWLVVGITILWLECMFSAEITSPF